MYDIVGGILTLFTGWLVCIIADKHYQFKGNSYYWFVGAASGFLSGLALGGVI